MSIPACSSTRLLLALLPTLCVVPAQHWAPLHPIREQVLGGAWDAKRNVPVAIVRDRGIGLDLYERTGEWRRRDGEGRLGYADAKLWTDPIRGRVIAFGAMNGSPQYPGHAWDGVRWQPVPGSLLPQFDDSVCYDSVRDRALLFGGQQGAGPGAALFRWDGLQWSTVPQAGPWPPARGHGAFAFDRARGRAVLHGGMDSNFVSLNDTWEWDGQAWTQFAGPAPSTLVEPGLAFDALSQALILFGGPSGGPLVAETWRFDGTQWTQLGTPANLQPRLHPVLIEVPYGIELVGGDMAAGAFESWLFGGGLWLQLPTAPSPAGRTDVAMAYDEARGKTVVFAGLRDYFSAFVFHDTWTFDGVWQRRQPSNQPPWRVDSRLVYDDLRAECVLFGGNPVSAPPLADTWIWDGTDWNQRTPAATPPARRDHGMVYDAARGRVVMFGGHDGQSVLGDTWLWNGSSWQNANPPASPPARSKPWFAFDRARGYALLHGGVDASTSLTDTWTFDGTTWQQRPTTQTPIFVAVCEYDRQRGRVLALGNYNEWSWDGTDWQLAAIDPIHVLAPGTGSCYDVVRGRILTFGGGDAYVGHDLLLSYTPTPAEQALFGNGCAGPGDAVPGVFAIGRPAIGAQGFACGHRTAAIGQPVLSVFGLAPAQVPIGGGCELLVGGSIATLFSLSGANGFGEIGLAIPNGIGLRGVELHTQSFTLQNGGLGATRRLRAVIGD